VVAAYFHGENRLGVPFCLHLFVNPVQSLSIEDLLGSLVGARANHVEEVETGGEPGQPDGRAVVGGKMEEHEAEKAYLAD